MPPMCLSMRHNMRGRRGQTRLRTNCANKQLYRTYQSLYVHFSVILLEETEFVAFPKHNCVGEFCFEFLLNSY